MRTLKFIVDRQLIRHDPSCDFSNIVQGTKSYLQAEFTFSPEWDGIFKVAEFQKWTSDDVIPVMIVNGICKIPDEVTESSSWKVNVVGKRGDVRLTTDTTEVRQI